jgi:hypothetical protein
MQLTPPKSRFPRRRFEPREIQAGACFGATKQLGAEDKMRCVVCGKVASVRHRLKISTKASRWTVRLCSECDNQVAQLSAVTELLWFQARRIDVLALASASLCKSGRSLMTVSAQKRDRPDRPAHNERLPAGIDPPTEPERRGS